MLTKYLTYWKECTVEENKPTEFEFINPKMKKEYESMSHELVNVLVSDSRIYYTFKVEFRLKGSKNMASKSEDEEVSPFER